MPTSDFEKRVGQILRTIEKSWAINHSNKRKLKEFHRSLLLAGVGAPRRQKLLSHLKIIAERLGPVRFEDVDRAVMEDLVEWIYTRKLKESTIQDYKQIIKQFWRWLHEGTEPEATAWIRRGTRLPSRILPQSLLTPAEVQRLIEGCVNDRDRAFIALLWETGARIGELIDLKVGEIEHGRDGPYIVVVGKTGSRRLPLVESLPYLEQWLCVHPSPEMDVPLWCKIGSDLREGIGYNYIRLRLLERARERSGIQKPVNPHHFRHSRATYLANWLTEAQMCAWFGWTTGSRMARRYVHLSGRDIDRAYRALQVEQDYHPIDSGSIRGRSRENRPGQRY